MPSIVLIIAFFAFVYISIKYLAIKALTTEAFGKIGSNVVGSEDVPLQLRKYFDTFGKELEQLGFTFNHYEARIEPSAAVTPVRYFAIFENKHHRSYLELCSVIDPDHAYPLSIKIISRYQDYELITCNGEARYFDPDYPGFTIKDCLTTDTEEFWGQHLDRVKEYESASCQAGERLRLGAEIYAMLSAKRWNSYLAWLLETDRVKTIDGSCYYFTLKAAYETVKRKSSQETRYREFRNRILDEEESNDHLPLGFLQHDSFKRIEEVKKNKKQESLSSKWLIFMLSAIAFVVLFGLVFDWAFALMIFVVLLIHELGHLVAMWLFGYRNFHLMYCPLGAYVTGDKEDKKTLQEIFIYLAGPVPGLLMSLVIVAFQHMFPASIRDSLVAFAVVSIFINGFNLLPLYILDGGRILNLLLSRSWLWLRWILNTLFLLPVFLLGIYMFDGLLIFVLLVMLYLLFDEIRGWYQAKSLGINLRDTSHEKISEAVFSAAQDKRKKFLDKYNLATRFIGQANPLKPDLAQVIGGSAMYLSSVALLVVTAVFSVSASMGIFTDYSELSTAEVEQNLLDMDDNAEKFYMLESFTQKQIDIGNYTEAESYLLRAKSIAIEAQDEDMMRYWWQPLAIQFYVTTDDHEHLEEMLNDEKGNDMEYRLELLEMIADHEPVEKLRWKKRFHEEAKISGDNLFISRSLQGLASGFAAQDLPELEEFYLLQSSEYAGLVDNIEHFNRTCQLAHFYLDQRRYAEARTFLDVLVEINVLNGGHWYACSYQTIAWSALLQDNLQEAAAYLSDYQQVVLARDREFAVRYNEVKPWFVSALDSEEMQITGDRIDVLLTALILATRNGDNRGIESLKKELEVATYEYGESMDYWLESHQAAEQSTGFDALRSRYLMNAWRNHVSL